MALYDYAALKRALKRRMGRPTTDEAFTVTTADDVYDDILTEAQTRLNQLLGLFVPDAIWTVPTALTSADGGLTYSFGTDTDGAAIFAFGHFQLFEKRSDIPNMPLTEGVDFRVEGTRIRMPDNVPRTFADAGPWAQFASPSNVIDATHEPVVPLVARPALLNEAEIRGWNHLGLDTSDATARFEASWNELVALIQTQSSKKGSQPLMRRPPSYLLRRR